MPADIDRCWEENPPLKFVNKEHTAACWRAEEIFNGLRIADYSKEIAVDAIAAVTGMIETSPTPFMPIGFNGDFVSWNTTSTSGTSGEVGSR